MFKNAEWSVLKGFQDFADLKAKVHEYDNAEVEVETLKLVAPFPILPPARPLPSAASDSPSAAHSAASPAAGGGDSDAGGCVRRSEKEEEEAEAEAERQRKLLNDYVRELSTKMVLLPRMLQIEVCSKAN